MFRQPDESRSNSWKTRFQVRILFQDRLGSRFQSIKLEVRPPIKKFQIHDSNFIDIQNVQRNRVYSWGEEDRLLTHGFTSVSHHIKVQTNRQKCCFPKSKISFACSSQLTRPRRRNSIMTLDLSCATEQLPCVILFRRNRHVTPLPPQNVRSEPLAA